MSDPPASTPAPAAHLLRTIGFWSLTGLVVNSIIGSGVFALPGTVAESLGWLSLPAQVVAAALALVIMLVFGEVASRFVQAGGPYLYAQAAFGRFAGLQMGWMALFVRILSAAVQVNLLTTYLAEFWPAAGTRAGAAPIAALLLGILTVVNLRGARPGTHLSSTFAVLKIGALLAFAAVGAWWIAAGHAVTAPPPADTTPDGWLRVLLLLMFAYGGFESAMLPMSESRNPQHDAPRALLAGLAAVALIYLAVQVVVLTTLADPGGTTRPLATAAGVLLGRGGAVLITIVAMISVYGWGSAAALAVPRLTFAMAERGDLPRIFAAVHRRWRTPWFSILFYGVSVFVLSQQGSLIQNISLSTVSRLLTYGFVCAALPALRHKEASPAGGVAPAQFRIPGGTLLAGIGLLATLTLVARMSGTEAIWLVAVSGLAFVHWLAVRRRPAPLGRP
jgi:APA family basic amino acid/polyamine antiporter